MQKKGGTPFTCVRARGCMWITQILKKCIMHQNGAFVIMESLNNLLETMDHIITLVMFIYTMAQKKSRRCDRD